MKTAIFVDFGLKVVKLTNSFYSRVGTQGENINYSPENCKNSGAKTMVFCQKPQILAKQKITCLEKVTPIFYNPISYDVIGQCVVTSNIVPMSSGHPVQSVIVTREGDFPGEASTNNRA